jgi:hypothetical protein
MFFAFFLLSTNSYGQTNKSNDCFNYPRKISKLKLQDNYNNSRWILFNWLGAETLDDIYYGQMELIYKDAVSRNDTTEIYFGFYDLDTTKAKKNQLTLVAKATVAFKQSTKQFILAYLYPFIAPSRGLRSGNSLLEGQLTETTSNFLKLEKNKINKCFLELAKKKKIID